MTTLGYNQSRHESRIYEQRINGPRNNAERNFIRMKYGPVFILGVVGGNSSVSSTWDHFRIYGALNKTAYKDEKFRCCLMYRENGKIVTLQSETISERRFSVPAALWRFHVGCPNVKHAQGKDHFCLTSIMFNIFFSKAAVHW